MLNEYGNVMAEEEEEAYYTSPEYFVPIPHESDLLTSLEVAQEEIYGLESENNSLRSELKMMKFDRTRKIRRLAVFAFRQQNRDRNFLVLREEISDLKATIVKIERLVGMKMEQIRNGRRDKIAITDRMQAQIDVLNKQLAHSIDANEVVREERRVMTAEFRTKGQQQRQHMAQLYGMIKAQSRQFTHLIVSTMCLTVDGIMTTSKKNSLFLGEAVSSLEKITSSSREYSRNQFIAKLGSQPNNQPNTTNSSSNRIHAGNGNIANNIVSHSHMSGGSVGGNSGIHSQGSNSIMSSNRSIASSSLPLSPSPSPSMASISSISSVASMASNGSSRSFLSAHKSIGGIDVRIRRDPMKGMVCDI